MRFIFSLEYHEGALSIQETPYYTQGRTVPPKVDGPCSYYDIGDAHLAAWSYREAYPEVGRISKLVSFEPDIVSVQLDGTELCLEPGQTVISHGPDRDLTVAEALPER